MSTVLFDKAIDNELEILDKKSTQILRIGLFGLGVVGSGVWRMLEAKQDEFYDRFGIDVEIAGICVRDPLKERDSDLPREIVTDDTSELLQDDSIDVIIELIGGRYEALDVIERALRSRKHVITANKLVLSHELPRLRKLANRNGVNLFYSASVCGSVPVLKALDDLRIGDRIKSIQGIVNGSTNFILTSMTNYGLTYDQALAEARIKGFLEADPTLDVSGQDAAQKLSVLIYHAFGKHVAPDKISTVGIENITAENVASESRDGKVIKLIAGASVDESGNVIANVQPKSLPGSHVFATTSDEFNALEIIARHAGPQILHGKGAGSFPTASAVISDVVELLREQY
ncbi:MAG: homoserine dehydrogenase [Candidatus Kapaibacterium sp.]